MNNEFKKIKNKNETRYILETATAGAISAGAVASNSESVGALYKRLQELKAKVTPPKPRNFVAKHAKTGGAGAHQPKKRREERDNKKLNATEDRYRDEFKRRELGYELRNEPPNNIQIVINGKPWKVFAGRGRPDSAEEYNNLRRMRDWAASKSQATGKKWEVYLTGAPPTTEGSNNQITGAFSAMGGGFSDAKLNKAIVYFMQGRHQEGEQFIRTALSGAKPEVAAKIVGQLKSLPALKQGVDPNTDATAQKYINDKVMPWIKNQLGQNVAEGYGDLDRLKAEFEATINRILDREAAGEKLSDTEERALELLQSLIQGIAEEDDPLQARADYAARHGQGQVYKTHYPSGDNPYHNAGKKDPRGTKMYAYDIKRTGPKGKLPKEGVAEGNDYDGQEQEYNDEAGMVKNNIHTILRVMSHLEKAIQENENIPEWCQEKIAVAKSMLVGVMDYMISQHEMGTQPDVQDQGIAEEKIKGVDGKACWKGKRYAGKVKKADGTYKDKCVEEDTYINQLMAALESKK